MSTPNVNLSGANYSMLAEWVKTDLSSAEGVKNASIAGSQGSNVVVSVKTDAGQTINVVVGLPDIDKADAQTGSVDFDKFEKDFAKACEDIAKGQDQQVASRTTTSGLTDIWQIAALLLESAKAQKESAAKIRAQSHEATATALQNEATNIRKDAESAYNRAMTGAIVQAVTTGLSTVMSCASFGMQMHSLRSSDIKAAGQEIDIAKNDVNAANKLTDVKVTTDGQTSVQSLKDQGIVSEHTVTKHQEMVEANTKVDSLKAQVENPDVKGKQLELDNKVAATKKDMDKTLKNRAATPEEKNQAKAAYEGAVKEKDAFKTKMDGLQKELDTAKVDAAEKSMSYDRQLKSDIDGYEKGLQKPITKDQARDIDKAKAFQQNAEADMKPRVVEGTKVKLKMARDEYTGALGRAGESKLAVVGRSIGDLSKVTTALGNTIDAFNKAEIDKAQMESQARSKSTDAKIEMMRADSDSIGELVKSDQDVVQAVLAMLQGVNQAMHSSVEGVLKA